MIFSLELQARANLVLELNISMVLLSACWADSVMLSASSRITILCFPLGRVTFCWANILILFLTTSIPRSLLAFSSSTASLKFSPRSCLARQRMVVVFPTPGGPAMMMLGTFPSLANTLSLLTVSWLPTISWNEDGRYFSIHGTSFSFFSDLDFSGSAGIFHLDNFFHRF